MPTEEFYINVLMGLGFGFGSIFWLLFWVVIFGGRK